MLLTGAVLLALGGCAHMAPAAQQSTAPKTEKSTDEPEIIRLNRVTGLSQIIPELKNARAVLVGEAHSFYHHHLAQLEVIKRLYAQHPDMVIGMEMFQQPFQSVLDQYIAGDIDDTTLLEKTEYYKRWKFDFRLYAPILHFARAHKIRIIALNIDKRITTKVGKTGISSLSVDEKAQIPVDIDRHVAGYEERIHPIFNQHANTKKHSFEHFMDVQLLWDEGMAKRAAEYLNAHPDTLMVILAGSGHIAYGTGIPERLARRLRSGSGGKPKSKTGAVVTILSSDGIQLEPGVADYVMFPAQQKLPKAGLMGVFLDEKKGHVEAIGFSDDSAGKKSGIRKGDIFSRIDGRKIADISDIRLAMWDKKPGDVVDVVVMHNGKPLEMKITLK